jgi:pimeloyl-ACP methyl ester carboxylesterase
METGFLNYKNSKVHYTRFGEGSQLLIALHGFADQGALFCALEQSLSSYYTVYSIDLPFHGKTKWSASHFDQKDLSGIIEVIRQKEAKERINFMGYSMGGRLVQKLLFEWIPVVDKVYLIAPDGLNTKWMFNVNMMPLPLRHMIHWLLKNPNWMIWLIRKSYRWKLISKFIHDFAFYHISTKEKRDRIFNTWYSLGQFRLNLYKVKKLLLKYPIPVTMFFGKRDEVIPPDSGKLLSDGLNNVEIHLIDEGHLLIDEKLNKLLADQLQEKRKL